MKCIYCGTDTNYPTRNAKGGRCAKCNHPFAFEPKTTLVDGVALTDGLFSTALKDIAGEKKLAFTRAQLYYEFCRRINRKRVLAPTGKGCGLGCLTILAGLALAPVMGALFMPLMIVSIVAGLVLGVVVANRVSRKQRALEPPRLPLTREHFEWQLLGKWAQVHGELPQLTAAAPLKALAPGDLEPDVTGYSFDRVLVLQDRDLAAMLVANQFHFETNCAVMSTDGYPEGRAETILTMLRRNPQLKVFAMHDATAAGCNLPFLLRDEWWFPDTAIPIFDLGLRPADALALKLIVIPLGKQMILPKVREVLKPEELAWLEAGNGAELACMRPSQLMRAAYQGITRAAAGGYEVGPDGIIFFDPGMGGVWYGGSTTGAPDSFG